MPELKIKASAVSIAASYVDDLNKSIHKDLPSLERSISRLDSSWDGSAADAAMDKFRNIINTFSGPRFESLNNFVLYLKAPVAEGYTEVEEHNTSLADAFK